MKLGINTYTYMWSIGFPGAQPEKPLTALGFLEKAHELGVKLVQSGPNLPLDQIPDGDLSLFDRRARGWGIEIEIGTRGLEVDHIARQADLCAHLNSRLLRTVPEVDGQAPPAEEIPHLLRAILPILEAGDLRLGLENGKIPAEELRWALDEAGSPRVGVVLDTVNSLAVPEGWKEVTRILAPYVMCLHYKDFAIRRVWSMMGFTCEGTPAGKGQIHTAWLMDALKASRYDFNVVLELWTPEQKSLEETIALEQAWARESIAYLRQWIPD